MKILVTGGAGYIGSITSAELARAGHEVIVVDNLYQGHRAAVPPEATFIEADLAHRNALHEIFAAYPGIDGIMHFASYTLVGESMEKPFLYLRDNLANAANLLEAAIAAGVRRFILSSTANLFDQPERIPIAEHERIVPGSPYGESKFFIERMLHWMARIYGMRYACLRYFNACGAEPGSGLGECTQLAGLDMRLCQHRRQEHHLDLAPQQVLLGRMLRQVARAPRRTPGANVGGRRPMRERPRRRDPAGASAFRRPPAAQ